MLIHLIVRADLRCDVGQMNIVRSAKLHRADPPPSNKTFFIDFCRSPVFVRKRCKQRGFSNYSCMGGGIAWAFRAQ